MSKLWKFIFILSLFLLVSCVPVGRTGAVRDTGNSTAEKLEKLLDGEEFSDWQEKLVKELEEYELTDEEEKDLDDLSDEARRVDEGDERKMLKIAEGLEDMKKDIEARLKKDSKKTAKKDSKQTAEEDAEKISETSSEAPTEKAVEKKLEKKTGMSVNIAQVDYSAYPTVKLYLDVRDQTGAVLKNLSPNMFYVSERQAQSGEFTNRTVKQAVMLNQNDRLNINMIADTSGSMDGQYLISAKQIMSSFLNTVQFSVGDQVKLTQFNTEIDKSGFFTSDIHILNGIINSYYATGGTKLYDAIVYGVQDASGQAGAKCVIAFTDGEDTNSYYSAAEVESLVASYKIPVFIVRIGDNSYAGSDADLMRIANASGGSFKNLSEFSTDMSSLYENIYRQIKEYYVVEYDAADASFASDKEINVYVQNDSIGGESTITTNPGRDVFDTLLGNYLRSYIVDMNARTYNQMIPYIDSSAAADDKHSIQWQMKKQVAGGFANVVAETLMDYRITYMAMLDENTVHIKAEENYDMLVEEYYRDIRQKSGSILNDVNTQLARGGYSYDDNTRIKVWSRVNQKPEYILKKGTDGKWRFYQYTGDLALQQQQAVYGAEVVY